MKSKCTTVENESVPPIANRDSKMLLQHETLENSPFARGTRAPRTSRTIYGKTRHHARAVLIDSAGRRASARTSIRDRQASTGSLPTIYREVGPRSDERRRHSKGKIDQRRQSKPTRRPRCCIFSGSSFIFTGNSRPFRLLFQRVYAISLAGRDSVRQ